MKTKVETITPEYAMSVLDNHNPNNRSIAEATVQSYATDMKNGRWLTTHQGIAFYENGDLYDGQHRLWAVVFANVSVDMNVSRGVPMSAQKNGIEVYTMDTIDRNRPRTVGQQFQLCHGINNPNVAAAACRAIGLLITPNASKMSTANALIIHEHYGEDIESVYNALGTSRRAGLFIGPIAMYHHGEPARALKFCQQISTLEDMESASAAFARWNEKVKYRRDTELYGRVMAFVLLNFHKKKSMGKITTNSDGREWLTSMFPSITKEVRTAFRPCEVKSVDFMRKTVAQHKKTQTK